MMVPGLKEVKKFLTYIGAGHRDQNKRLIFAIYAIIFVPRLLLEAAQR
jgi:hypothetical protein